MNAMKKSALALLALGILSTSGCDRHSDKEVYYLIATNMNLPYWQTAVAGFQKAAAQYKVTAKIDGPNSYNPAEEKDALTKAIAAKPAGILISVADSAVLQPEIDAAIAAGIPVITMDSDAAASHRLFFIGTNNLEAGRLGGKRIVEKLGGKGNVVFFSLTSQPNTDERLKGFKDVFASHPDIKVVEVVDMKGDARNAFDKTQEFLALTGPKKIDAFVCLEASSGKVVADAIKRSGGGRELVAWDVDQDTLDGIKAGGIDATIAQKPYTMGYVGLRALDEIFHAPAAPVTKDFSQDSFSPYPQFIDTGTSLVDQKNVDLYLASAQGSK
jgi:ribose transport system substrate-binding protein